jgi:hypothetical protein
VDQPTPRERLRLATRHPLLAQLISDSVFNQPRQIAPGIFPAPGRRLGLSSREEARGRWSATRRYLAVDALRRRTPICGSARLAALHRGAFRHSRATLFISGVTRRHISEPVAGGRSASGRPRCRPGIVVARHEPQAPHPAPPSRRLAMAPSDEPGDKNIIHI